MPVLRCISPIGARDLRGVPGVDRIVEVGEEITVSAEAAGTPAGTYRPPTATELASPMGLGGLRTRGGDTGPDGQDRPLEVRDPGSGLLAQPEHWQLVASADDAAGESAAGSAGDSESTTTRKRR